MAPKSHLLSKNYFKVHFSITMAYRDFKFCLHSLYTHSEGPVSQIVNISLGFYSMSKDGKHFTKIGKHHF